MNDPSPILDNDFFYVRAELFSGKHERIMGNAVWVYLCTLADPSYTDISIAKQLDMLPANVRGKLRHLASHGYIEWRDGFAKRARKKNIPRKLRWEIWNRDKFTCRHCGSTYDLTVDHIDPESEGGKLVPDNLQTLCRSCNSKKGSS